MFHNAYVVDIETDGLDATRIHCLCYQKLDSDIITSLTDYGEIKKFLEQKNLVIIGHNFIKYDKVQLNKLLSMKGDYQVVDTLGLSWILSPKRKKHGLEEYGVDFGVPKPVITDWSGLSTQDYIHRCTEDVKINMLLWQQQYSYFKRLYDGDLNNINNFFRYVESKLICVAEQEEIGVKLDVEHCRKVLTILYEEKEKKLTALKAAMPKDKKYDVKNPPAKPFKKDGSLSAEGIKWLNFLEAHNLSPTHNAPVKYIKSLEDPNPGSHIQIKNWLYSLGWTPDHIKYDRNKETGEIKEIPQVKHKDPDKEGEVSESIKSLFAIEPALEVFEGLTILTHRISIFEGFLRDQKNGRLHPSMSGFTNTMRLKHTVVVNLPKVGKLYGEEVRGALIADDGMVLCGSDLTNIESQTRNHYIFPYDPDYVADMTTPGFDSHLDIAKLAGFLTEEQVEEHKSGLKKYSDQRNKGKTVNFAAVYGSGALTLSRNSGLDIDLCTKLLEVYWERNWAVRKVAENVFTKEIDGQMWLYNPISGFYYSLRHEKDRFSTLNQGSAVYVFDVWMNFMRQLGIKCCLQMHDEVLFNLRKDKQDIAKTLVQTAMNNTNDMLNLNVTIGCSADFGDRYSDCH